MISCKFKCIGINLSGEKIVSVTFSPVKDESIMSTPVQVIFGENTPCGNMNLTLIPEVATQFVIGKVYILEFKEYIQE